MEEGGSHRKQSLSPHAGDEGPSGGRKDPPDPLKLILNEFKNGPASDSWPSTSVAISSQSQNEEERHANFLNPYSFHLRCT